MIERLLREIGLSTGRFTSPAPARHPRADRPRRRADPRREVRRGLRRGAAVHRDRRRPLGRRGRPPDDLLRGARRVAYAAFADAPVDVAVVEVGMGGSWDATNVVDGQVAVVTPIAIDHERFLGRPRRGHRHREERHHQARRGRRHRRCRTPEVAEILLERGRRGRGHRRLRGQRLRRPHPRRRRRRPAALRSAGWAATTTTCSCRCTVRTRATTPPSPSRRSRRSRRRRAAARARRASGPACAGDPHRGGWRSCAARPTVLVDAAHNPAGAQALVAAMEDRSTSPGSIGVVAVLADKDAARMLEILEPVLDEVVVTRTTSPRAMSPARLGELAARDLRRGPRHRRRQPARRARPGRRRWPRPRAGSAEGVLATGSITTAAEVRMLLGVVEP